MTFQFDERRVFTGATKEIPDSEGVPLGWTRREPPPLANGEWAVFSGQSGWQIVNVEPDFPETPVPKSLTRRQFTKQLIVEGLDDDVESFIGAISDPVQRKLTRAWYRDSQVFERYRPELIEVAEALGKTSNDMDNFFRKAVTR
ncbi:MAG: hypothetical protein HLX50_23395 [Alteromonadaceae bacterium]|nr:hypothetical protein [Alteromonadaceae bacterium]